MGDDVPSLEQLAEMGATETEQPEQQSEQQPSTAEQQQGKSEDAVAEHVMEDLVDSVSSYVSKKTGLPQQAVKQLLTDLIRTDEDFASEFASTVSRVKSTLQDLAVGNTSKRVLDYTMARAISKLGNKMIARIEDDYYADDYADIKRIVREVEKFATKMYMLKTAMRMFVEDETRRESDSFKDVLKLVLDDLKETKKMLLDLLVSGREKDSDKEIKAVKKAISKLYKRMEEMLESRVREEHSEDREKVLDAINQLGEKIDELEERINRLKEEVKAGGGGGGGGEGKSILDELENIGNTLERMKSILQTFGYKVYNPTEDMHARMAAKKEDPFTKAVTDQLIPTLVEMLKEPQKLRELAAALSEIRKLASESGLQRGQTSSEVPSIEQLIGG